MSLRRRLIISYIAIIVLCLGLVAIIVTVAFQSYSDRFVTARLDDMTRPIYVQVLSLARGEASADNVWENLKEQARITGVYIFLVDDTGNVIRQVTPSAFANRQRIELPSEELPEDLSEPYHGTFETDNGKAFIFVAYPFGKLFSSPNRPDIRAIVLAMPRSGALAIWSGLARPFFWAGVIAFVVSLVIAMLLARSVYRPIQMVAKATREMARGQYDHKIPIAGPSDVKGLAVDFNQMAYEVKVSQQRLRDFLSDVSHQLRTPLTSIRGFAQAILDGTAKDNDSKLRAAQVIEDEAKRMIRQVNELLELARIQSGQLKIAQEPVDIASLLRHCQEVFSLRVEEKGIILMTELGEMMSVSGDIDQLEKAFSNLIDNAIKHTPSGGQVSITGRQVAKDSIEVTVSDTGSGISQKELPYIFERFYQGGGVESGIGLGLAIAREIVRTHGGDIEVDSTMEKGTRFILNLPTSNR